MNVLLIRSVDMSLYLDGSNEDISNKEVDETAPFLNQTDGKPEDSAAPADEDTVKKACPAEECLEEQVSEEEQMQDAQQEELTEVEQSSAENTPQKEKSGSVVQFIYDTVELVAISLVAVMVILTVFTRHSPVNGSSMYPTILGRSEGSATETIGKDTLLISNLFYSPKKGDIVVVQTPNIKGESNVALSLGHPIVKRIIATEGDRVEIDFTKWQIIINGQEYEAGFGSVDYVNYVGGLAADGTPLKPMEGFYPAVIEKMKADERYDYQNEGTVHSFTVPSGQVFILGDNRNNSKDSRAIGLIDERWIIGKSIIRIYPFDRIGVVD